MLDTNFLNAIDDFDDLGEVLFGEPGRGDRVNMSMPINGCMSHFGVNNLKSPASKSSGDL